MQMESNFLPKTGDFQAFVVSVWYEGILQFTLERRLTGTELAIAINRKCVKDKKEALEKLKNFSLREAKNLFESKKYNIGEKNSAFFSPCW